VNKQAPTLGKLLIMVGFALSCFGLLLFLWLAFGGPTPLKPKGYRFEASFGEATQLAQEADVRISGVPVGKVKTVEPNQRTGRSVAVIELEDRFAPLPRDSKATLRQKTLLGETYVELTPGSPNAPMIPEDGRLAATQVSETVELDEIFRAFDPRTRRAFQTWIQSQSRALRGRALDINDTIGNLEPFAEDTGRLLRVLNGQQEAVRQTVRNTGVVFDAISERRGQLQSLVRNGNRVFETTATRDDELRQLFTVLPTFNTEAETTVRRLERFAEDTDPLVTQLRPAARELAPTFAQLRLLAPDLRALFRDIDPLITASQRGLPATEDLLEDLRPALGEFDPTLKQLNPILNYIGNYKQELQSFFVNPPASTQAVGSDGVHYLRTLNPQNPENLAVYPRRIGSNRPNAYRLPESVDGGLERIEENGGATVYESRHCGRGVPQLAQTAPQLSQSLQQLLPTLAAGDVPGAAAQVQRQADQLAGNVQAFFFGALGTEVPAPPCRQQDRFRLAEGKLVAEGGELTQFPHVREARSSTTNP